MVRVGYSKKISIEKIHEFCQLYPNSCTKLLTDRKCFCNTFLLSVGFKPTDFKFGVKYIFFRTKLDDSKEFFEELLTCKPEFIEQSMIQTDHYFHQMELKAKETRSDSTQLIVVEKKDRVQNVEIGDKSQVDHYLPQMELTTEEIRNHSTQPIEVEMENRGQNVEIGNKSQQVRHSVKAKQKRQKDIEDGPANKRKRNEKMPHASKRYDRTDHLPDIDRKSNPVRCKNDDCNYKTYIFCKKCDVHLCLVDGRNCFLNFHTLNKKDP